MLAMHDAARRAAKHVDALPDNKVNRVTRALWPAVIKFVGKGVDVIDAWQSLGS